MKEKMISILNLNADITVLNDIRLSNKSHLVTGFLRNNEQGNFDFFFNSSCNARGVGIIIKKKTNLEITILHKDTDENVLIVSVKKGDSEFILGAIYGPRQHENEKFIEELMGNIDPIKNLPFVLVGDFNLIPSTSYPLRDIQGSNSIPNPRNSKKIEKILSNGELIDLFRAKNGNIKEFTFMGFNRASSQRSRIDLAFCNKRMLKIVKKIKHIILQKKLFDHKACIIDLGGFTKSKNTGANMSMLNLPLTKVITHCSILTAVIENAKANEEIEGATEMVNGLRKKMINIRSKLNICSNILSESVKKKDKLLKQIAEESEKNLKKELIMLPSIETVYDSCSFELNHSMLLQLILNEVTLDLKSFQAYQGKIKNHLVDTLHDELRIELNKSPTDPFKIYSIEEEISNIENEKLQEWIKRFNSWEIINREKSQKGFCALNKTLNKEVDFVTTIKNTNYDPPREFKNNCELNEHVNSFYGTLFMNNNDKCTMSIDAFLEDLDLDENEINELKVPESMIKGLGKEINIEEIEKSLKTTSGSSAPGLDGFSYDFIKMFFHLLKFPMLKCYQYWIKNETVSDNFCFSKIKLLPKKDDLHKIQSWRPIALLSTFYKVFSGCLSNRIKPVADIVNVLPQKAYSSNRNIAEANIDLCNIINASSAQNVPMAICALDFRKAFDSVSNSYAIELFSWMGMPKYIIKMLKACILGKKGFISNLENSNSTFNIGRGFAQGDRPSGIEFGLCVNLAFFRILKHPLYKDITIPLPVGVQGPENLLSNRLAAFADDGNAKIAAVVSNLALLKKIFSEFELTSGLVTNFDKTSIIPFNAPDEFIKAIPEHGFRVEYSFTTLGIEYTTDHRVFITNNEKNLEKKIDNVINYWKKFYLSLVGKISVTKTFLYSQIAYLCTAIKFSEEFEARIEKKIIDFVNSFSKIGKEKVFQKVETGGLGLFKVRDYCEGIRISFFRRSIENNDTWAAVINNCRDVYCPIRIIEDETLKKFFSSSYSLVQTYNAFTNNFFMLRGNVGQNRIFNNNNIKVNRQPLPPPEEWSQGDPEILNNLTVNSITDENSKIRKLDEINKLYKISIEKAEYKKIKNGVSTLLKNFNKKDGEGCIKLEKMLGSKTKGSKRFRKIFENKREKKTTNLKPTRTREKLFSFTHHPETEKRLYACWNTSFLNNEVRTFLYRIANNQAKLNIHIAKFDVNRGEFCKSCETGGTLVRENYKHFFFECPATLSLLINAKKIFRENLKYDPAVILINNIENNATRFERIIAGIMCYVLYHGRNRPVTKIMYMNSEFKKIICASADTSNYFKMNVSRYIDLNVDPFK